MPAKKKTKTVTAYPFLIYRNLKTGRETSVAQGSVHDERLKGMKDRVDLVAAVDADGNRIDFEEAPVETEES